MYRNQRHFVYAPFQPAIAQMSSTVPLPLFPLLKAEKSLKLMLKSHLKVNFTSQSTIQGHSSKGRSNKLAQLMSTAKTRLLSINLFSVRAYP